MFRHMCVSGLKFSFWWTTVKTGVSRSGTALGVSRQEFSDRTKWSKTFIGSWHSWLFWLINLCRHLCSVCCTVLPVPLAARSKAKVCGLSPADIVGSNPTGSMDVFLLWVLCVVREYCVLSGLCDELIIRPEESYWLWCVVVCDLETCERGGPSPLRAVAPKKTLYSVRSLLWLVRYSVSSKQRLELM
jgi:hypothetical protein